MLEVQKNFILIVPRLTSIIYEKNKHNYNKDKLIVVGWSWDGEHCLFYND